jgi:hypothetical protein
MNGNPYEAAFFGWLFFTLILLGFYKDDCKKNKKEFTLKQWFFDSWIELLTTICAIPLLVYFRHSIWQLVIVQIMGKRIEYNHIILICSVPLTQLAVNLMRRIRNNQSF